MGIRATPQNAAYVWSRDPVGPRFDGVCDRYDIGTVFLSTHGLSEDRLRICARRRSVHALFATNEFVTGHRSAVEAVMPYVHAPPFAGLHLDVEPRALDGDPDANRASYLGLLDSIAAIVPDGVPLGVSLPPERDDFVAAVLARVDYLCVMIYDASARKCLERMPCPAERAFVAIRARDAALRHDLAPYRVAFHPFRELCGVDRSSGVEDGDARRVAGPLGRPLDAKGIHVPIPTGWSELQPVQGGVARYRLWRRGDRFLCLKLLVAGDDRVLFVSESLENVDVEIGEIFEIDAVPFDARWVVRLREDGVVVGDGNREVSGTDAQELLVMVFGDDSFARLVGELRK